MADFALCEHPSPLLRFSMGLDRKFLESLHEFARAGFVQPGHKVIEIGAQQLAVPFLQSVDLLLDVIFKLFGQIRPELGVPKGSSIFLSLPTRPSSRLFWEPLGFSSPRLILTVTGTVSLWI